MALTVQKLPIVDQSTDGWLCEVCEEKQVGIMCVHSHTHTQTGKHNLDVYYNSNHNHDINFYPKCCISSELKALHSSTIYTNCTK